MLLLCSFQMLHVCGPKIGAQYHPSPGWFLVCCLIKNNTTKILRVYCRVTTTLSFSDEFHPECVGMLIEVQFCGYLHVGGFIDKD